MGYVPGVMRKKVYDTNENQKVDSAEDADTVDGIQGSEILKKDGSVPMTGDLNMGENNIENVLEISGVSGSGVSLWGTSSTAQAHFTIFAKDHASSPNKINLTTYVDGVAKDVFTVESETDHPKFPQGIETDTISEKTSDSGVTIDGCLIKDGKASTDIAHISDIPGPIDSILTDHNKATHDALGIAWTSLTGTPSSFSGQKGMIPRVKSDETGLEFKHNAIPTTLVVAANDAKDKLRSDYACDGTGDQTEINNAINALPT